MKKFVRIGMLPYCRLTGDERKEVNYLRLQYNIFTTDTNYFLDDEIFYNDIIFAGGITPR